MQRERSPIPGQPVIRDAAANDAPAIAALIASLAHYFLADPSEPGSAADFFETVSEEAITGYLTNPRYQYRVAEAEGAVLGVIGMRDTSHLYHLFVAEPSHRRGFAAALWQYSRDQARSKRVTRFTVNSSRFAVPLYERFGFAATGPLTVKNGIAFMPMELEVGRPPWSAPRAGCSGGP